MKITITLILILCGVWLNAQSAPGNSDNKAKDSTWAALQKEYEAATNDSLKIHYHLEIADHLWRQDMDSAKNIVHDVIRKIGDRHLSSEYFKEKRADAFNVLGNFLSTQGRNEKALEYHLDALKVREEMKDTSKITQSFTNIGRLFRRQKDFETAKTYLKKAVELHSEVKDSTRLAIAHNTLAITYYYNLQNDSALYHYELAKKWHTLKRSIASVNNNIATVYLSNKEYEKAIPVYLENLQKYSGEFSVSGTSTAHFNLAYAYFHTNRYTHAYDRIDKAIALAHATNDHNLLHKEYLLRSRIGEKVGRDREALADFKTHKTYLDSINDLEKIRRITTMELNYQFEKEKLADSIKFAQEKEITEARAELLASKNRVKSQWMLFGGLGVLALFSFIGYRYRQKIKLVKLKNQLLSSEIEYKRKDLANLAINISQSQSWAGSLLERLEEAKSSLGEESSRELEDLEVEIKNKMRVDGDAEDIQLKIDTLSSAFYEKLNDSFPDLTANEIRLCSLIRMDMGTKDIAVLQNIDPLSVKKGRSRLRKKLNLLPNDDISMFLKTF